MLSVLAAGHVFAFAQTSARGPFDGKWVQGFIRGMSVYGSVKGAVGQAISEGGRLTRRRSPIVSPTLRTLRQRLTIDDMDRSRTAVQRARYMTLESIAPISDDTLVSLPLVTV